MSSELTEGLYRPDQTEGKRHMAFKAVDRREGGLTRKWLGLLSVDDLHYLVGTVALFDAEVQDEIKRRVEQAPSGSGPQEVDRDSR